MGEHSAFLIHSQTCYSKFQNNIGNLIDPLGNLTGSALESQVTHKRVKPKLHFEGACSTGSHWTALEETELAMESVPSQKAPN